MGETEAQQLHVPPEVVIVAVQNNPVLFLSLEMVKKN